MSTLIRILAATAAAVALGGTAQALAGTPVPGYTETTVAGGFTGAIALDFAPDGRIFVAEQAGILKVIDPGGAVKTVLDISDHVNAQADRGLTGVAVDRRFASNGYVYLFYTYEATHHSLNGPRTARLTRIKVRPDDTVAHRRSPETVILGTYRPAVGAEACPPPSNTSNCLPADGTSHVNDSVRTAPDGTLFLSLGDSIYHAANNPSIFRTFNVASAAGKVLHITTTGTGVAGHPFCQTDTTLSDMCTRVYAAGFRNPFRFDVPATGPLMVGDVGQAAYEEIDRLPGGGNYGWPCYEGPSQYAAFSTSTQCAALYAKAGTPGAAVAPLFSYPHDIGEACIIGGPVYTGSLYPDGVIYGDYVRGTLDVLLRDAAGQPAGTAHLEDGWLGADLRIGPDGLLYTAGFDAIRRLQPG